MQLSVVVTIVDAGETLVRCLAALAAQQGVQGLDVIVPWDDSVPGMADIARRFPAFSFPALGRLTTARAWQSASGQHELFDRRRAAGLALVTGDVIAILEDRGVPRPDWAAKLLDAHTRLPHAVIGGGIELGRQAPLNRAVFFCDFNRYQPPFEAGPREWVSDVNIGYKRRAIDATREIWRERYHETSVHWALVRMGEVLFLSPDFIVEQMRDNLSLGSLVGERFAWGRLFAYTRAREMGLGSRLALTAGSVVLPLVLLLRHARMQQAKGRLGGFLRVAPSVAVLLTAWSLGEALGYLTARP